MKNRLKKYITLFSLLLVTALPSLGCWFGTEFEDVRYIILNPGLANNKTWWAYFYTSKLHYVDGDVKGNQDELQIAAEWKAKFKLKASPQEIESYLFGSLTPEEMEKNAAFAEIRKNTRLSQYFDYAASCSSVIFFPDPWQTINTDSISRIRSELIPKGISILTKQVDPFWQKKYAFQVLRLAFYQNETQTFNRLYNTYFEVGAEKTPMDWWATHYKSMVLEKTDVDSANYLHALVFCHSSNKMFASQQWFSSRNFEGLKRLARHDSDLADLYVMKAVINPGKTLDDIQEVTRLSPNHPLLPLLLVREMNKLEDWIGTHRYSRQWNWMDDTRDLSNDYYYLRAFYKFVKTLPVPAQNPDLFHLISANLALMNQDVPEARVCLDKVTSAEKDVQYQKRLLLLMLDVLSGDINSTQTADAVGETLYFLLDNGQDQMEFQKTTYSVMKFLENHLKSKGANHLAGLLDYVAEAKFCSSCRFQTAEYEIVEYFNNYGTAADVEKVLALFDKKDKNRLEEFVLQPYPNNHYFVELLGTLYMREGNVKKARDTYARLPETFWENFDNMVYLDEDPFRIEHFLEHGMHPFYTKLQIADRMLQLEESAKTHPEDYLPLAHAWYNFSGYGNSWFMLQYYQYDYSDFMYDHTTEKNPNGPACGRSLLYYTKALGLLTNPEHRAEAYYGMATVYYAQEDAHNYIEAASAYEKLKDTQFHFYTYCTTTENVLSAKNRQELIENWSK